MKEKLKKQEVGFAQVKNEVLNDPKLSWKAKGIFAYIYSKPDDWDFSVERAANDSTDGPKATRSGVKELEKAGYLTRRKLGDRRMEWFVTYKPVGQNGLLSTSQNVNQTKRQSDETDDISNKDLNTNKELITNIEETLKKKTENFIEDLKKAMDGITIKPGQVEQMKEFVLYWTEPDKNWEKQKDPKIRYDHEETWDMRRRIAKWFRNSKIFNKSSGNKYQVKV
jgi:hypothetical protein